MSPQSILTFWFGQERKAWFAKNPAFDEEIRSRFLGLYEDGLAGKLDHWKQDARSALALVILLDQFPRNMFRDSARAFEGDRLAREVARTILDAGWNRALSDDERTFAYLPFEHSESREDQELSLRLFEGNENFEWARRHWEIIQRFGRFPHRNAILGRSSTPEEIAFLKTPGSGF